MKATEYYIKAFKEYPVGRIFVKWNWSAFFFSTYWLAYRRMYIPAAVVVALYYLLVEPAYVYFDISPFAFGWIPNIILGLFGTSIYGKRWVRTKIPHYSHTTVAGIVIWFICVGIFGSIVKPQFLTDYTARSKIYIHEHIFKQHPHNTYDNLEDNVDQEDFVPA